MKEEKSKDHSMDAFPIFPLMEEKSTLEMKMKVRELE